MPKNINQKEKKKRKENWILLKFSQRIGKKESNCHMLKDGTVLESFTDILWSKYFFNQSGRWCEP